MKTKKKLKFTISFTDDDFLKFAFLYRRKNKTYTYIESGQIRFLKDFIFTVYDYLLSYHNNKIEHNNYFGAQIMTNKNKIVDVEFKLLKKDTIGFRIWKRKSSLTPNTESKKVLNIQIKLKEFLSIVLNGYSGFLKKYGLTQINRRLNYYSYFPVYPYLNLKLFLNYYYSDNICDFNLLEKDIPFILEKELLSQ